MLSDSLRQVSEVVVLLALTLCITSGCAIGSGAPAEHAGSDRGPARPSGEELLEAAAVFADNGDRMRAIQYLTLAQRDGVPASQVVPRLLTLYTKDGQYRLAIDTAVKHLRLQPDDIRIRSCLGGLYLAVDASEEALLTYEAIVEQEPTHAEAHYALASILTDTGKQRARADEHYRAYLSIEPKGRYADEVRAKLLKPVNP